MSVYSGDKLIYLQEALESLYVQDESIDIFVQQDGQVSQEVSEYLRKELEFNHIVYLGKRDENRGLAYSLNELLSKTIALDYEFIARMDADDISIHHRISLQYNFMKNNPEIDVVGGYIEEFSDKIDYNKIVCYPLHHNEMFLSFSKRVPVAHVTTFFRKSFFEKAGFYPTSSPTNEDTLLWMNGFKAGCRFANIPEILVKVRVGKDFFGRRGGITKAWSDFKDRLLVVKTLGYNTSSYFYAIAVFLVNISPAWLKKILYKRLR